MKTIYKLFLMGLVISTFSGCAYQHRKPSPEFAPVRPATIMSPVTENGSIYQTSTSISLFETNKARRVGDILTVVFDEKHVAKKETKTEDNKSGSISLANPTIFGQVADATTGVQPGWLKALNMSVSSTNDFKSKGKSEQKNSLTGSLSVSVVEVLANGNLVIRGEKLLTLNQGDEYVQLSGIIRTFDLGPDNKVASSKVANAKIVYSGQGMTHDSNKGGWGTRFFLSDKWPF
ncbi:MAG: flagellar basal body L-ring protein FlgH [Pseudomonadota bacterium]